MGTRATLVTYDARRARALARLDRILEALDAAERELSTWRPESVVSQLNRQPVGVPLALPRWTCDAIREVSRWHAETRGAFDPTVGRLVAAWGIAAGGRLPAPAELAEARRLTGLGTLHFDARTCEVARARDVEVDTGGFGKGAALDRAAAAASDGHPWLVDLGGQVMVSGTPPDARGWQVLVAHPEARDQPVLGLSISRGSLATSGGSERDVQVGGVRVGHILDPRTGRPASFRGSVTVWHSSGLVADILSTALFVMGPAEGLPWAEAHDIAVCYLTSEGHGPRTAVQVQASPAFARRFPDRRRLWPSVERIGYFPEGRGISR